MNTFAISHVQTGDLLGVIEAVDALHALSAYSIGTGFSTYDHEGTADMVYENTPERAAATYLNYAIQAVQVGPQMVATFDLTDLTPSQIDALAGEVQAQAEESEGHPDVGVTVAFHNVAAPEPPRTMLVHLNIEVPADAPCTVDDVVREINGALAVGIDPDQTPALTVATIVVPLAEEI